MQFRHVLRVFWFDRQCMYCYCDVAKEQLQWSYSTDNYTNIYIYIHCSDICVSFHELFGHACVIP